MSVLSELQEAVAAVATAAAPSVVGIGSRNRGSGVVEGGVVGASPAWCLLLQRQRRNGCGCVINVNYRGSKI